MSERESFKRQVYGESSHVHVLHALDDLDMGQAGARPNGATHSIYQLVRHMVYWQDIALRRMRGDYPPLPPAALEGWTAPAMPASDDDWQDAVDELASGLWEIEALAESPDTDFGRVVSASRARAVRDELLMVLMHNSYHLGQIVMLRRQLGAWPPPRGGDSWG